MGQDVILSISESQKAFKDVHASRAAIFRPRERLNVWQYADKHRYLAKGVSAKTVEGAELYNSAMAPHQRGPQESVTDPAVQMTVLIMASQIGGKTEMLLNVLSYHMEWVPRSGIVMYPQLDAAEKFSKKKLAPNINANPNLAELVKPSRSRDSGNTILTKDFRGGSIYMVGANSPASLRGASGAVLLADEVDSYEDSAGTEGDPIELLWKRGESFPNCVKMLASTPTVKGQSKIWGFWDDSDQQFWHVPCPKCGAYQQLTWKQITWPAGEPERAELLCSSCAVCLTDKQRLDMYYAGRWQATAPFKGIAGFHLNGIYCPWPAQKGFKNRLHQMAEESIRANKGGERKLQVWVNTFLCELWEVSTEKIDHHKLLNRAEDYDPQSLPDGVIVVMAACDVQKDRIECETIGLGLDDETWGIEFRRFQGDTEQDDVWQDLAQHLSSTYRRADGVEMRITSTAIDMRHKGQKVRQFVQRSGIPRVYPVYGIGGNQPTLVTTRFNKHYRLRTYAVNGKEAKDTIYARLKIVGEDGELGSGPRYMHFPAGQGYNEEYFLQLTAEVLKSKKVRGVLIQSYEKTRERNEALDIRVYFLAEVDILKPNLTAIAKRLGPTPQEPKPYQLKPPKPLEAPEPTVDFRPKPQSAASIGEDDTQGRQKIKMGGGYKTKPFNPFR